MDALKSWLALPPSTRPPIESESFAWNSLSASESRAALSLIEHARLLELKSERAREMKARCIPHGTHSMRFTSTHYGDAPPGQRSLYISMHGGGGCTAADNDTQWQNQQSLYAPAEGFYVAPRAPTNTWDLWHQPHIDPLFDRLIENFTVFHGVDPNKVYIAGYSAGGDGVYRLAPRMADRWAAAAMMAGHPGEAQPHNLNNTPYVIQCGGKDTAYERNKRAQEWGAQLRELAERNPGQYPHKCIVYRQYGHWMNKECAQAFPWMATKKRKAWARKVVWHQGNVLHKRFAWLANRKPEREDLVSAEVSGQTITVKSSNVSRIRLRLCDELMDLDRAVVVKSASGRELFNGTVRRSVVALFESMLERFDASSAACAFLDVRL